jgi:CheY-like chemotaxis protein
MIQSNGEHLLALINDILDVSKIESGKFELRPESVDVREICQSSLAFIREQANKKEIQVEFSALLAQPTLLADPRRLKQVLVNLLSNAVKFTPERGTILLNVEQREGQFLFSVSDTGIGIEADDVSRLFKPFVQLHSGLTSPYEGTGLGLMLVKQLTELHGGTVTIESEVGKGSRFTVALPQQKSPAQAQPMLFVREEDGARELTPSTGDSYKTAGGKILIAEDNEANLMVVRDYLERSGYHLSVARDGLDAIAQTQQVLPDLILMDIGMPKMDGLEVIRHLRTLPEFAATPIIALTALAMPGDRERCLDAGANEYMAKPIVLKRLAELIRTYLTHS